MEKEPDALCVAFMYAPQARIVLEKILRLPKGSTVREGLQATGWQSRPEVRELLDQGPAVPQLTCGVWGKTCGLDQLLQDNDRVELYRPLLADPKAARRERFARQGSRGAGLFARRRSPAKPQNNP